MMVVLLEVERGNQLRMFAHPHLRFGNLQRTVSSRSDAGN